MRDGRGGLRPSVAIQPTRTPVRIPPILVVRGRRREKSRSRRPASNATIDRAGGVGRTDLPRDPAGRETMPMMTGMLAVAWASALTIIPNVNGDRDRAGRPIRGDATSIRDVRITPEA